CGISWFMIPPVEPGLGRRPGAVNTILLPFQALRTPGPRLIPGGPLRTFRNSLKKQRVALAEPSSGPAAENPGPLRPAPVRSRPRGGGARAALAARVRRGPGDLRPPRGPA